MSSNTKTGTPGKGPSKPDNGPRRLRTTECAIVDGFKPLRFIGGKSLGLPSSLRCQLVNSHAGEGTYRPFFGVQFDIPLRADDPGVQFNRNGAMIKGTTTITLKWYVGEFTATVVPASASPATFPAMEDRGPVRNPSLIRVVMNDNCSAVWSDMGKPMEVSNPSIAGALYAGFPFDGVKPLLAIAAQRQFFIVIARPADAVEKDRDMYFLDSLKNRPRVFAGYGTGRWDMSRYLTHLPNQAKRAEYNASTIAFDDPQAYEIAHELGVVYDVFQLIQDVKVIRKVAQNSVWLRLPNGHEWLVLVRLSFNPVQLANFQESIDRSLNGGGVRFGVAFDDKVPTPGENGEDRDTKIWPAIMQAMDNFDSLPESQRPHYVFKVRRPTAADVGYSIRGQAIVDYASYDAWVASNDGPQSIYLKFNSEDMVAKHRVDAVYDAFHTDEKADVIWKQQIKRDLFTGDGFFRSLSFANPEYARTFIPTSDQVLVRGLGDLKIDETPCLPYVDVFGPMDDATKALCLAKFDPEKRDAFVEYLRTTRLGLSVVIGCAGAGKTSMLTAMGCTLLMNPNIGKVYAAAPTNVATTNFAVRCYQEMADLVKQLPPKDARRRMPVIIRGYSLRSEAKAFLTFAWRPFRAFHLWANTKPAEEQDQYRPTPWAFAFSVAAWGLAVFKYNDQSLPLPKALQDLRDDVLTDPEYEGLVKFVMNGNEKSNVADIVGGGAAKVALKLVVEFLARVVQAADMVCTTPFMAKDEEYAKFNMAAKAVILDEAGAMLQADALLVLGNGLRPCVLAGDKRHLPPTVMTLSKKDVKGNVRNPFAQLIRVSPLEHFERSSVRCFMLDIQHRITVGGFDVAKHAVYHELAERLTYGPGTKFSGLAVEVDKWLEATFKIRPSNGRASGLFVSCPGECTVDTSKSLFNLDQIKVTLYMLDALFHRINGPHGKGPLTGKDIVVVTPYRGSLVRMQRALSHAVTLGRHSELARVEVNSTDSFQGREADIVVFLTVVNQQSSPKFVSDSHRLCVGLTWHKHALIVVGDINTVPINDKQVVKGGKVDGKVEKLGDTGDGGQEVTGGVNRRAGFRRMLEWYRDNGRVAALTETGAMELFPLVERPPEPETPVVRLPPPPSVGGDSGGGGGGGGRSSGGGGGGGGRGGGGVVDWDFPA
ncbi:P-loop containing nucleoside triphosphate hydrolase protein [Cercophora samala]|uniref:P-loop containing nucleoside triphosphate hydrolase protein n=1 Tax=Cercophora samala TaxID=330535 RepID=A0AA40D8A2_9PEZI|nr:P-loop containing nucleoside triphosphate hydrolase protein [Cercophora samala]